MLRILLDSAPDGVDKSVGFAQALTKESLKSLPPDKDVTLIFYLMLVLLPAEQVGIFQENSRKQNLVSASGTVGGKVIFALLKEILIFQVSFTLINVREPSF